MSKVNVTTDFALFNDDSNEVPVNLMSKAKESGEEEERVLKEISSERIKTFLEALYEYRNGHMIAPASWSRVISEDEGLLQHVYALHSAEYEQKSAAMPENLNVDVPIFGEYISSAKKLVENSRMTELSRTLAGTETGRFIEGLRSIGYFSEFSIGRVRALTKFLDGLNAQTGSEYNVFEILSQGVGGLDKVAFFLSSSKLSPLTSKDATAIQKDLLMWLRDVKGKSFDDVAVLLGFATLPVNSLTFENMDTLIAYVALRDNLKYNRARSVALFHLRQMLGDFIVTNSILNGMEEVQSAKSFLRGVHDTGVASAGKEDNAFAIKLQHDLWTQWFEHGLILKDPDQDLRYVPRELKERVVTAFNAYIQAANKAYWKNHLTLRPPGT
ncbi:unnamed protein product [Hyaloperonospora brassicae]|uniref:RxLR effector candidate protein n=1 Tax=Hyaloperonospora brassicae TaxID=162125 RepID=A0AAV0V3B1_HYABA|nr:unnamed protein product [Hyaloperonospora brassicae]